MLPDRNVVAGEDVGELLTCCETNRMACSRRTEAIALEGSALPVVRVGR